jgi:hypothetical protein
MLLWRDLVHAGRSLAKARAFTFVCVVSLGIGMAPVIAIPYVSRLTTLTPPQVNTEELVELVTKSVGPHQQTEHWSYPDYVDLRDANTGLTLIGCCAGGARRHAVARAGHHHPRCREARAARRHCRRGSHDRAESSQRREHGDFAQHAEPIAYVVGPAIAVPVAVLASLVPARRAASVQPMVAMRSI